jgi:hypothetical protein
MAGTTNFQQFNPPASNQETDAQYTADSQRSGGLTSGAIFPSNLGNKVLYQITTFIAALSQSLAAKGYSPVDGAASPSTAVANLQSVLANLVTQVDLAPYALLNSPTFTGNPQAPTQAVADSDNSLATTAFVHALIASNFSAALTGNGYIRLPDFLGGLLVQWKTSVAVFSGRQNAVESWPIAFPSACFVVLTTPVFTSTVNTGAWQGAAVYVNPGTNLTAVNLYSDVRSDGHTDSSFRAFLVGIGH